MIKVLKMVVKSNQKNPPNEKDNHNINRNFGLNNNERDQSKANIESNNYNLK